MFYRGDFIIMLLRIIIDIIIIDTIDIIINIIIST
jgi:hypothetical protein